MNKQTKTYLLFAAVLLALYMLGRKSGFAVVGESMDPTGLWTLERGDCESSYSDNSGKSICGVDALVQKNIHRRQ